MSEPPSAATSAKSFTLGQISDLIGAELVGDRDYRVQRPVAPGGRVRAGDIVIAFAPDPGSILADSGAQSALIAAGAVAPEGLAGYLVTRRPRLAMARLLNLFAAEPVSDGGIHQSAVVHPSAQLGEGVSLGPHVVVGPGARIGRGSRLLANVYVGGEAVIGDDCLLYPGVCILDRVRVGDRNIIHANAVLGADGFGFVTPEPSTLELAAARDGRVKTQNGPVERIASLGTVETAEEVEIGACTTIDRGTLSATRIGRRTKIDNQVQIGHNVRVGEDCLFAGKVGLAGSVVIGNRVMIGGAAGVADGVRVGDDALIAAAAGVIGNVPAGEIHAGVPALRKDHKAEEVVNLTRLPRVIRELLDLRRRLEFLERAVGVAEREGKKHD